MYEVKADAEKNRLYITLGKFENYEEMFDVALKIREETQKLKQGFDALTDLRKYEVLDENFEELMKGIQQFLFEAGVSKVVRVVRKFGAWGHVQLDRASMDAGYHAEYVHSMEAALAILDGKDKR